jgi:aryl-alcohol dehydrogenase-like predicted oxidoreductase
MEMRTLGKTGLDVSRLGVGLSEIRSTEVSQVAEVLNAALDAGINFLDTSACYGNSEELIGRTVSHRRDEFILATKAGHVTGGYQGESWDPKTVRDSIDRSLKRLRTDHLDIVQLHTCSVEVLERGEVIEVLQEAKQAGKTRAIGYSGDNEGALWAVQSGLFDTLQTSFNLVDQNARLKLFEPAVAQTMGIIAKRPIANGAWGASSAPSSYAADYFERAQIMASPGPIPEAPDHRILLALGFTLAHEAVDTAIVGTQDPEHMRTNIKWVENRLPISEAAVAALHERFERFAGERNWRQLS